MEEVISKAIENNRMIQFNYKDELRLVEPYTYGVSKKGNDQLRAFQTDGGSNSDSDLGWRLFTIDNMENITILNNEFKPTRDGYNPDDSAMVEIYITV